MRQTFLVVVMIFAIAINVLLGIAIWPHLSLIGTVASWVAADILLCIGVVFPVATLFFLRWLWFYSSVVRRGEVVVGHYRGEPRLLSAEHEAAKLQLPAPRMDITEADKDSYSPDDLQILAMVSRGKSQTEVATLCNTNQTYVSRLVRRYKEQHNMVD